MDKEIKGDGNSYTTTFRQLDPRLGRWMSLDPVFQAHQSPYNSMDNNPIVLNDVLGNFTRKGGDPANKILNLNRKINKAIQRGNTKRAEKLRDKRNNITTGNQGELYQNDQPKGRTPQANYDKHVGDVIGDPPPPKEIDCDFSMDPKSSGIQHVGFRIAIVSDIDGDGNNDLQVLSIAIPQLGAPTTPEWTRDGLNIITSLGGNVTGLVPGDIVQTNTNGDILNQKQSETPVIYKQPSGISSNDTYQSVALDFVKSDAIIRYFNCFDNDGNPFICRMNITNQILNIPVVLPIKPDLYNCK
jgi:RHS repeat-associated protein